MLSSLSSVQCHLKRRRRLLFAATLLALFIPPANNALAQMTPADTAKLQQALAAYDQVRSQEAQPVLQELLTHHPANFEVNETLGLIHAEAGDFSTALPLLERAARLHPGAAVARANLGTAYLKLNQPRKALPELEAAAHLQPRDQQTQTNLAHAYMETGGPAKAARAFTAAAALGQLQAGRRAFLPGRASESDRAQHLCMGRRVAAPLLLAACRQGCRLWHPAIPREHPAQGRARHRLLCRQQI